MTFSALLEQFKAGKAQINSYQLQYDSYLDTLSATLKYLNIAKADEIPNSSLADANEQLNELKNTISQTGYTARFIKERKALLAKEAGRYVKQKLITRISKEDYYYGQALSNYKEIFSDKTKAEVLALHALNKIPVFQDFMRRNSMLASQFQIPGNNTVTTNAASLAGLQTRASVQDLIQQRIAAGGPNAAAQMQQNLSEAQSRLNEMKDKLLKGGSIGAEGDVEMPDGFKPNSQRSKTLWQRLEYGFDVQFAKNNSYLPSTTDIAVSIGYKLNDRSVIGAGVSYKLGLGSINRIRFSSEGVGLRSCLDWKIKGQWFATGGYELNYQSALKSISALKEAVWQKSALIGISRQYQMSRKLKGEVKVLYDFMASRHVPAGSPFVFRVGYKF